MRCLRQISPPTSPVRRQISTLVFSTAKIASFTAMSQAKAPTAVDLNKDLQQALRALYKATPIAWELSQTARAILAFPNVVKTSLLFGGSYGEGELIPGSKVVDYYNTVTIKR